MNTISCFEKRNALGGRNENETVTVATRDRDWTDRVYETNTSDIQKPCYNLMWRRRGLLSLSPSPFIEYIHLQVESVNYAVLGSLTVLTIGYNCYLFILHFTVQRRTNELNYWRVNIQYETQYGWLRKEHAMYNILTTLDRPTWVEEVNMFVVCDTEA